MEAAADPAFVIFALVAFGLVTGSFLNVCIYRMPLGKSIVTPRSACPSCGTPIRSLDNMPVLSYLILRGKCRACGAHISMRYPLVEALNAALFVLVYLRTGMGWHLPVYLAFASAMVVVTFIDLDHQIIPDEITVPGVIIAFAAGAFILPDPFDHTVLLGWRHSLIGAATGFVRRFVGGTSSALVQEGGVVPAAPSSRVGHILLAASQPSRFPLPTTRSS